MNKRSQLLVPIQGQCNDCIDKIIQLANLPKEEITLTKHLHARTSSNKHHLLVGVKPFGHFHCRKRVITPSHGKINVKPNFTSCPSLSWENSTKHSCSIQHVVIVWERVAWDIFDTSINYLLPDGWPKIRSYLLQLLSTTFAIPERLQSKLEFSFWPDARISNNRRWHCPIKCHQIQNRIRELKLTQTLISLCSVTAAQQIKSSSMNKIS